MKEIKRVVPQLEIEEDSFILPLNKEDISIDTDWMRIAFQANTEEYDAEQAKYQYRSPVFTEMQSTVLGNNFVINPPYSWGPTSDMHYKGRLVDSQVFTPDTSEINIGMGRYYAEAIQRNAKVRTLIIEPGVAEFKSTFSFIISAIDRAKVIIAREGRTPFFYYAGYTLGTITAFTAFPVFTIAFYITSFAFDKIFGLWDPRFYYVKPTMSAFWSKVNTIANTLASDRGVFTSVNFISKKFGAGKTKPQKQGYQVKLSQYDRDLLSKMLPHIFKKSKFGTSGLIDVAGLVGKYQTLVYKRLKLEHKAMTSNNLNDYAATFYQEDNKHLEDFADKLHKLPAYKGKSKVKDEERDIPKVSSSNIKPEDLEPNKKNNGLLDILPHDITQFFNSVADYYKAAIDNGMDILALQVEYVGSSTDTFSNTVKDIPLKEYINGTSNRIRDIRFTVSDGNWFGNTIHSITKAAEDVIAGYIDGATLGLGSFFSGLTGGGVIDFPKMWDDSSTELASHTFKLHLNTPYNNPISLTMDLDIPLACILGLALPQSIGRTGYTSPPLLKTFMQGIINSDISILTNLSITRGGGNLGHTLHGAPLDLEITFQITDLNPAVHSPTPNGLSGLYEISLDEYSGINRYSKLITGQGYMYSKFIKNKALLNLSKRYGGLATLFSPEQWGMRLGDSFIGHVHSFFRNPELSGITLYTE